MAAMSASAGFSSIIENRSHNHPPSSAMPVPLLLCSRPNRESQDTLLINRHSFAHHHSVKISQHPRLGVITISASSTSPGIASSVFGEEAADLLDKVQVLDLNGNGIPITDLWSDRKAVVAFARHFGCVLCRKRADYLANKKEQMDAAGVALVLIGPGSVNQAKAFFLQTKFKGEVYADPSHSSYEALQFISGVSTTFTPKAGLKIIQSYMEGYRQDWGLSFEEDTVRRGGWQQGGIIVAGPGKSKISYIHKDKEAGDDPPIEDVLKACCSRNI